VRESEEERVRYLREQDRLAQEYRVMVEMRERKEVCEMGMER
jgi:hypothetical protein